MNNSRIDPHQLNEIASRDLPHDDWMVKSLELEQQLDAMYQHLEHAQRLATIGELTSTTTHEFNNLLMTIMNYAKLGMRHKDEPTRDKAFAKIFDASTRAGKITTTILGLARNRSGQLEPTNLAEVIRDTLVLLEKELQKYRILLEVDLQDVPPANAEANQIQRVLINLLTNARQAIGENGMIKIKLSHDVAASQIVLVIRDSGAGIPADKLPRIFEPFYTTKHGPDASGKGGSGLGLASCKDIIDAHQGKIRVESAVGKGTAFYIRLPVAPSA